MSKLNEMKSERKLIELVGFKIEPIVDFFSNQIKKKEQLFLYKNLTYHERCKILE